MKHKKSILIIGATNNEKVDLQKSLSEFNIIGHFLNPFVQSVEEYANNEIITFDLIVINDDIAICEYLLKLLNNTKKIKTTPIVVYGQQNNKLTLDYLYSLGLNYYMYKFSGWTTCISILTTIR